MPDGLSTRWIATAEDLRPLEAEWDGFLSDSTADTLFLTFDWLSAWWESFGEGRDLRILVVRREEDGLLVGAAPLVLGRGRWLGLLPMREMSLIGAGIAAADHLDFPLRRGFEAVAGRALWERLSADRSDWDVLRLDGFSDTSPMLGVFGETARFFSTNTCRFMSLPETWEAYLQTLPSKRRRRIGWRRRRLEKEFPDAVQFRTVTAPGDLDGAMDSLFRLHQEVQTGRGNPGSFAGDTMRDFHRAVARRLLKAGRLRLHLITVDGEDIAAIYCFRHGDALSFYSTGFAGAWDRHNPGRQVMAFSMESAIDEGAGVYDFLRGDESYKEAFEGEARLDLNLRVALRPGARLLLALEWLYKALRRKLRPLKRR